MLQVCCSIVVDHPRFFEFLRRTLFHVETLFDLVYFMSFHFVLLSNEFYSIARLFIVFKVFLSSSRDSISVSGIS